MEKRNNFSLLNDVALAQNGARIIFATDDFFAVAENLIKMEEPESYDDYTEFGKRMDGWETRRRRKPGHDFLVLELAAESVISAIELNTAFFTGNYVPRVSIQASKDLPLEFQGRESKLGSQATEDEVAAANDATKSWPTILERVQLLPGFKETQNNAFSIESERPVRYLRLNAFPDGGIARLRVYAHVAPPHSQDGSEIDLASLQNGGECVAFSNAKFSSPKNLIKPFKGIGMFDGWETARTLDRPSILIEQQDGSIKHNGEDYAIIKLGQSGKINRVVVDTNHFKGNFPDRVKIEGKNEEIDSNDDWASIVAFSKVGPNKEHEFQSSTSKSVRYVKLTMEPDGGISRLRVYGTPTNN